METGNRFHNPYFHQPTLRERFWQRDGWAYIGSLVLLIALVWYGISRNTWLWIDTIVVEGNNYLTSEEVIHATESALSEKVWFILPQRLIPFTDEGKLEERIISSLEQRVGIAELNVESDFPNTVVIALKERIPGYVYIIQNRYYYLDSTGSVARKVGDKQLDPYFPHIRERNKKRKVDVDETVLKQSVMEFMSMLVDEFTQKTHLDISEFAILPVSCQKKEYVVEEIFAEEIEKTSDEGVKQEKKEILRRLENNEITVDQSLSLLEKIKQKEGSGKNKNSNEEETFVELTVTYVEQPCDYATVVQDIAVVTQQGAEIYFDTAIDYSQQLEHLKLLLDTNTVDPTKAEYIDIRFEDRAYYR